MVNMLIMGSNKRIPDTNHTYVMIRTDKEFLREKTVEIGNAQEHALECLVDMVLPFDATTYTPFGQSQEIKGENKENETVTEALESLFKNVKAYANDYGVDNVILQNLDIYPVSRQQAASVQAQLMIKK